MSDNIAFLRTADLKGCADFFSVDELVILDWVHNESALHFRDADGRLRFHLESVARWLAKDLDGMVG